METDEEADRADGGEGEEAPVDDIAAVVFATHTGGSFLFHFSLPYLVLKSHKHLAILNCYSFCCCCSCMLFRGFPRLKTWNLAVCLTTIRIFRHGKN